MKATIHEYNADYFCNCGEILQPKDESLLLFHRGTQKKNKCPHAGKTFKRPTVVLEEVK